MEPLYTPVDACQDSVLNKMSSLEKLKIRVDEYLESLGKCNVHTLFIVLLMSIVWGITAFPIMAPAFTTEAENLTDFRTLFEDFGLSRDSLWTSPELNVVIFFIGCMLFGNIGPVLSDRYGRRPVVIVTLLVIGISCCGCAVSPNYGLYLFFRFLQGPCYSGVTVVNWVLVSESVAPSQHGFAALLFGIGWTFGYVLIAPLSLLFPSWRSLFLAYGIPTILYAILLYIILPESLTFMVIRNRRKEVETWMARARRYLPGVHSETVFSADDMFMTDVISADLKKPTEEPTLPELFRELWERKRILVYLVIITVIWIADMLIYNALSMSSTALQVGNPTMNFALGGLMELPAYLTIPIFMHWFGIKHTVIAIHATSGLFMLALFFIPTDMGALYIIVWCIVKFCCSCMDISHIVYASSVFPPELRGICMGTCATVKNLGPIIAPYTGRLNSLVPNLVYIVFGSLSFFTAAIAIPLPNPGRRKVQTVTH